MAWTNNSFFVVTAAVVIMVVAAVAPATRAEAPPPPPAPAPPLAQNVYIGVAPCEVLLDAARTWDNWAGAHIRLRTGGAIGQVLRLG